MHHKAKYKRLVASATIIQNRFRAKARYKRLVASATIIQRRFRAKAIYKRLVASATVIQRRARLQKSLEKHEGTHPILVDKSVNVPSKEIVGGIHELRQLLALRKVAIPRFRRADHSLLSDMDT
jgi:hypothetical protein